ncbi:MAG: GNAT family N-acetyltransferase [Acidimicrobiales bacterium]
MESTREPDIETPRLRLHHLSVDEMLALFDDPESASVFEGRTFANPHRVLIDDNRPLPWRVPQVRADPSSNRWFIRLIVERATREVVGTTSFHAPPNDSGMVEIGLGLVPAGQGRGLGTEAVTGMWRWAVSQPAVLTLRYAVSPANVASVRLVQRLGAVRVGEQVDDEDGPEDIYEMSAEEFRRRHGGR